MPLYCLGNNCQGLICLGNPYVDRAQPKLLIEPVNSPSCDLLALPPIDAGAPVGGPDRCLGPFGLAGSGRLREPAGRRIPGGALRSEPKACDRPRAQRIAL